MPLTGFVLPRIQRHHQAIGFSLTVGSSGFVGQMIVSMLLSGSGGEVRSGSSDWLAADHQPSGLYPGKSCPAIMYRGR